MFRFIMCRSSDLIDPNGILFNIGEDLDVNVVFVMVNECADLGCEIR